MHAGKVACRSNELKSGTMGIRKILYLAVSAPSTFVWFKY